MKTIPLIYSQTKHDEKETKNSEIRSEMKSESQWKLPSTDSRSTASYAVTEHLPGWLIGRSTTTPTMCLLSIGQSTDLPFAVSNFVFVPSLSSVYVVHMRSTGLSTPCFLYAIFDELKNFTKLFAISSPRHK